MHLQSKRDSRSFTEVAFLAGAIDKQLIETVTIGSRVVWENPRPWDYNGEFSEPDSATWSLARFSLQREDGSWIDVEMIRPAEYWEQQGAVPSELTYIEFPELEASGLAKVTSMEPCPPIASGAGQVVTARIVTRQVAELVEIEFVGGETLTGTPQHPIWSIERQDWVELGKLEFGEHLWTEGGPIEISSTRLLGTGQSIYNFEVHGHQIYQDTELGMLVHDSYNNRKLYSLYVNYEKKVLEYAGITTNFLTRNKAADHLARGRKLVEKVVKLGYRQARALEHLIINHLKYGKNLSNIQKGISPKAMKKHTQEQWDKAKEAFKDIFGHPYDG